MAMPPVLLLSARITGDPAYYQQLALAAQEVTGWPEMLALAESHGLGPLLYTHLRAAGAPLPPEVKQALQGLYLRHRRANQLRANALAEIVAAYQAAGIQALVLKGAALAQLLYPEPGLRPMGDLDLLVSKSNLYQAQRVLAGLGFHTHLADPDHLPDKHLLAATRQSEEFPVSVEIHYHLFARGHGPATPLEDLKRPPTPFSLPGQTAYTLGYEDMLWHLCHHLAYHTNVWKPVRLIWVADIVGLAEKFAAEIDWAYVAKACPLVLRTLSLLHFVAPLSPALLQQARLKPGPPPAGVGLDFQGWPRSAIAQQRAKGYRGILRDSFAPPEWWLRLHYGLGSASPLFWYRWVRHPLHILSWVMHLFAGRLGRRRD